MGHKHDEHCEHKPPVKPPVIEIPVPPPQEIHQVPIAGMPVLIPLLLCVAWVAIRRRKG